MAFIGSGSAGSTSVRDNANFFNVIDVHPSKLELTMFRAYSKHGSRDEFRPINRGRHRARGDRRDPPEGRELALNDTDDNDNYS